MGCPGGNRSVFAHTFWEKRELQCIFSPEEGDRYYIKTCHNDLFSIHNYFFLGELKKNWPEKQA